MKRYLCPYPGCGRPALRVKNGQLLTGKSEVLDPDILGNEASLFLMTVCPKGHGGYLPSQSQLQALSHSLQCSKAMA